jgi:hypothetical protein
MSLAYSLGIVHVLLGIINKLENGKSKKEVQKIYWGLQPLCMVLTT